MKVHLQRCKSNWTPFQAWASHPVCLIVSTVVSLFSSSALSYAQAQAPLSRMSQQMLAPTYIKAITSRNQPSALPSTSHHPTYVSAFTVKNLQNTDNDDKPAESTEPSEQSNRRVIILTEPTVSFDIESVESDTSSSETDTTPVDAEETKASLKPISLH